MQRSQLLRNPEPQKSFPQSIWWLWAAAKLGKRFTTVNLRAVTMGVVISASGAKWRMPDVIVSVPTVHRVDLGSIPSFGHFRIGQFFRKNRMLYNQKSGYYTSDDAGQPPTSVRVIAR